MRPIVLIWILIAAIGALAAAYQLRDAWIDHRAVRISGANGGRRLLVRIHLRSALIRLVVQLLFVDAGFSTHRAVLNLILGAALLVLSTVLDVIDRRRLLGRPPIAPDEPEGSRRG